MAEVSSIFIYPEKDEPGQQVDISHVSTAGLDGDRRKKAAVHLIAVEDYVDSHPRANLVITMPSAQLTALVGRTVRVGDVIMTVDRLPSGCAGVYASVTTEGDVAVGDSLLVAESE